MSAPAPTQAKAVQDFCKSVTAQYKNNSKQFMQKQCESWAHRCNAQSAWEITSAKNNLCKNSFSQLLQPNDKGTHLQVEETKKGLYTEKDLGKYFNTIVAKINSAFGGRRRKASKSKPAAVAKGPKPSAERVQVKGRSRVVYVGPKGGKYIKSKGEFVRL